MGKEFDDLKTELALCHRPKTEKKTEICTNSIFRQTKQLSLALVRACVAPVCDFKSEVEVVTHDRFFRACWGNVKEVTFRKYKKNIRVENSAG